MVTVTIEFLLSLELGVVPPTLLLLGVLSLRVHKAHAEGLGAAKSLHVNNLHAPYARECIHKTSFLAS